MVIGFSKFFLSFIFFIGFSSASFAGGASAANFAKVESIIGGGLSVSYASQQAARCSWKRPRPCIEAIKAVKQAIDMFKTSKSAHGVSLALGNGLDSDFSFDPGDSGFCFDKSSGCSPDALDKSLSGFSSAFSTGSGYAEALSEAESNAASQLEAIAKKGGLDVDLESGTITDRNGKVTDLNSDSLKIPSSLSKIAEGKLGAFDESVKKGSSSRSVASAGSGGLKTLNLKSKNIFGSLNSLSGVKKKKNEKSEFLAGLSDKDAARNGVGFAGDDIFNMIQRRYTKKLKGKEFIDQ